MKYAVLFLLSLFCCIHFGFSQYALDFNGGTDHVILNGADFPPPWTMEVLINKNETDDYQHLLTSTDGNSGIRNEQWYGTKVGFTQSGVADYYFNFILPIGTWVHMAIVNTGSQTTLYIDGINKGSVNASINFPMKWISKPNEEASMKAKIDDLRIWSVDLEQSVIQEWMDQEVTPSHPNWDEMDHYYKFDEGSGNTCYDSKGSLNGSIQGATWYIETDHDVGIIKRVLPENNPDNYSASEPLAVRIKNYGLEDITTDFLVSYSLDGEDPVSVTLQASQDPFLSNETRLVEFLPVNMNTTGTYHFTFYTAYPLDENPSNDTLTEALYSVSNQVGSIVSIEQTEPYEVYIETDDNACLKVIFYQQKIFRIWAGFNCVFSNPAGSLIIPDFSVSPDVNLSLTDEGDHYKIMSDDLILRLNKDPLMFSLYETDNEMRVWEEMAPLDYGIRTFQYLSRMPDEYFYGGGMQNGYFSHRDTKIKISKEISNWDDGAVPNPSPFYMSTNGYGALRNTFKPGEYDFTENMAFSHNEERFDCFYFYGPSLKETLEGYTSMTGRPFFPPRWGLELGDADCYNDEGQTTPDVIEEIAETYRQLDLPGGWILPNDGYGCGYEQLDYVVSELHDRGFHTGLWTESGLANQAWEVGTAGIRAYKLDVAWVGAGYQQALTACRQAYEGIENNCNERGFVWSVCGWAGTQRYSVVWSGDQSGNWEYIRFHIPTIIGAGLSGFNLASSDLDGIFGGSANTYVRDLQWKTFIPVFYAMSGWAPNNRQPWVYNTNVTDINREYLKLKMRLTPYMYTFCHEAHETGVPVVRAMVLEFPDDPVTRDKTTQYQFMSGEWFLVAPVYTSSLTRDSIYLPEGLWWDYRDGTTYSGPMFLNNYDTPYDKLPVFVKAGAIIPMYPEMLYDNQYPKDTITLDIYPHAYSSFELYEDDGVTRAYQLGAYAKTLFECDAPEYLQAGSTTITIGASEGEYTGKLEQRAYWLQLHGTHHPDFDVTLDWGILNEYFSLEELKAADDGYYFSIDEGGTLYIKTQSLPTSIPHVISYTVITGEEERDSEEFVNIYPNPTNHFIFIELNTNDLKRIQVFDSTGKVIRYQFNEFLSEGRIKIDMSKQPEGTYIVRVETENRTVSRKINVIR